VFARLGPAIYAPLAAQGSAEEAKAQRAFARTLVQTSNGDLRSRQGAQGRGSVASLATDGSDAYHFHDVSLTQLRVIDFLRSCVTDMDDFHNLFGKAGHSSLSTTSSLGEHQLCCVFCMCCVVCVGCVVCVVCVVLGLLCVLC
jgi:hypothetical protein